MDAWHSHAGLQTAFGGDRSVSAFQSNGDHIPISQYVKITSAEISMNTYTRHTLMFVTAFQFSFGAFTEISF
jgi:hypothetical protein